MVKGATVVTVVVANRTVGHEASRTLCGQAIASITRRSQCAGNTVNDRVIAQVLTLWNTCGRQDQPGDLLGLSDERNVRGIEFDRVRAHPLGKETFEIRVDGPVLGGHLIPARPIAPGGHGRALSGQGAAIASLNGTERAGSFGWNAAGEIAEKRCLVQFGVSVG